ncbi:hypothetical protein EV183_001800 [Coemansia sp. RSA 2336]|nr:hypothetical protein EV183_001800 [Coemansia sp. RSA 2336]
MPISVIARCGQLVREYRLPTFATVGDLHSHLSNDKEVLSHCINYPFQFMNSKKTTVLDETDMLMECTEQQDGKYIVFFGLSMYVYFVLGDELLDQIVTTSACSLPEVQKMAGIEPCLKIIDMSVSKLEHEANNGMNPQFALTVHCSM